MKKAILASALILCSIFANAQWQKTNSPNSGGVNCFANTGSHLFAGTDSVGTFLSTNNGDNWAVEASGLTNKSVKSVITIGGNAFAGTHGSGVFLSSDDGNSWTSKNKGLTNSNINTLMAIGTNIFAGTDAGVFISSDSGANWSAINTGLSTIQVVALAINGTQIFAGTYGGGAFVSSNSGDSWKAVNNGLPSDSISAFAISGSNIYAGTNSSGVFLSTDNGSSWNVVSTGLTNSHIWALVPAGLRLFAATGGGGKGKGTGGGNGQGKGKGGIFALNIGGNTWSSVNTGLPKTDVRSLYIVGSTMFAGTADSNVWKRPVSELTSGIADIKNDNSDLEIYPNPAINNIIIKYKTSSKTELVIYNVLGEMVFKNTLLPLQSDQQMIDISAWQKGVYFLKIGDRTEKIIRN